MTAGTTCNGQVSTSVVTNYKEYLDEKRNLVSDETTASIKAGGDYKKVSGSTEMSFSLKYSQDESDIFKAFSQAHTEVTISKATCLTITANLHNYLRPLFTKDFINGLVLLNSVASGTDDAAKKEAYVRFTSLFGTHYITSARFGAALLFQKIHRTRSTSQTQRNSRESCMSSSINFCLGGSASAKAYGGSVKSCVGANNTECELNSQAQSEGTDITDEILIISSRGSRPAALNDWDISTGPVPIEMDTKALQELITTANLDSTDAAFGLPAGLNAAAINQLLTDGYANWFLSDVLRLPSEEITAPAPLKGCGLTDTCPPEKECNDANNDDGYTCDDPPPVVDTSPCRTFDLKVVSTGKYLVPGTQRYGQHLIHPYDSSYADDSYGDVFVGQSDTPDPTRWYQTHVYMLLFDYEKNMLFVS